MRHSAFTLVELLVVISILALLLAVLLPAFSGARHQARTVDCRANIRQLLLSLCNYETEHQTLPYGFDTTRKTTPPGGYVGDASFNTPGWWWFHYTGIARHRSQQELDVLRCPAKKLGDPMLDDDPLCGNYGVNRSLCRTPTANRLYKEALFVGTPLSTGNLRHPGSTLLMADSGYSLITWWHATAEPPTALGDIDIEDTAYIPGLEINKDRSLWPGQTWDAIGGRHPQKSVNVGFADGHADLLKASELLVKKTGEGEYTNTLLWHAQ